MNVTAKTTENIAVIEVEGNIDSRTAPQFQESAMAGTADHDKVLIDLSGVEYMSSAGLRVLLMIYRQIKARNGKVVLVGVSEEIQDVMANTGFSAFFIMVSTVEEGIEALKAD